MSRFAADTALPRCLARCRRSLAGLGRAALVALVGGIAAVTGAGAHPHVFVDARGVIEIDEAGRLAAIRHQWTFDEFFSAYAVEGLDANGDGTYSREELADLAEINVVSLEDFGFFTFAGPEGEAVRVGRPRDYWLDMADGLLTLNYTLPLAQPVPLGSGTGHGRYLRSVLFRRLRFRRGRSRSRSRACPTGVASRSTNPTRSTRPSR